MSSSSDTVSNSLGTSLYSSSKGDSFLSKLIGSHQYSFRLVAGEGDVPVLRPVHGEGDILGAVVSIDMDGGERVRVKSHMKDLGECATAAKKTWEPLK